MDDTSSCLAAFVVIAWSWPPSFGARECLNDRTMPSLWTLVVFLIVELAWALSRFTKPAS